MTMVTWHLVEAHAAQYVPLTTRISTIRGLQREETRIEEEGHASVDCPHLEWVPANAAKQTT